MRVYSLLTGGTLNDLVEIEYHSRFQIPAFQILGLPAPEIQEAKERIMAAFQSAKIEFPKRKVIVNLAPASVKKSGTGHDLSIALKILSEISEKPFPKEVLAWGELSLDGFVKPAGKMATLVSILIDRFPVQSPLVLICSKDYANLFLLLKWRKDQNLPLPKNLQLQIIDHLEELNETSCTFVPEFSDDVKSDLVFRAEAPLLLPLPARAERVLKISLIGKHHVLLLGPKGVGKSESIKWYQTLLPDSSPTQTWQRLITSEYRCLPPDFEAPVRRVHSQVKPAHLLGSFQDRGYMPGELALAHGGLFIADEFVEWPRDAKECLREPLQAKRIFLSRIKGQMECPSDFQLVATGNLCPCGGLPASFRGDTAVKKFKCSCRPIEVDHYLRRISGPILDRIDVSFIMSDIEKTKVEPGRVHKIRNEIESARNFSVTEFGAIASELSPQWLEDQLPKTGGFEKILADITSLRSRHKILRVARSIQALEQMPELKEEHVFEAKWYRLNLIEG